MAARHDAGGILEVLHDTATAVAESLQGLAQWGLAGTREGQHHSDLVADAAALEVLFAAGVGVLSEESGLHHTDREVMVVVDPVDGSTNASRGLPYWATSLCALDAGGPLASVVVNQVTGQRWEASRGGGARLDGQPVGPSACRAMGEAVVAFSGYPSRHLGWMQYRSLGAAALDMCAVASGGLDAFIDCAPTSLAPWDYLGGLLICSEAGARVAEAAGLDLVVTGPDDRRTVVAAATPELLEAALAGRRLLVA